MVDEKNPFLGYTERNVLELVEVFAVSLIEVLPEIHPLSRLEKIRLIQVLAKELEQDGDFIEPNRSYPVWSPDRAFAAAATLLQAIDEDKGQP